MIKFIHYLFARAPYIEIIIRLAYWRFTWVHSILTKFNKLYQHDITARQSLTPNVSLSQLEIELREHGIGVGDILIVHSSMKSLSKTGATPSQIIEMLVNLLGNTGTLVMPAIPKYAEAITGIARIDSDLSSDIWTYDVQKTPPWTGAIPYKLMKTVGARRSRHPLNTVVAIGCHVDDMFSRELSRENSTPCGLDSSWAYCAQKNAKIVALGVDLAHSLTMIHVAVDSYEESWPIPGWYRNRQFNIKDNGTEKIVTVRERHPKWAMYYAERKLDRDLKNNGIAKSTKIGSISVISLESGSLLDFLNARKSTGYPYYLWRFWL